MENSRPTYFLLALAAAAGAAVIAVNRQMNRPETLESLEREVALHPRDAALHERLGNMLLHAGRPDDAMGEFKAAVNFDPKNSTAPVSLAALTAAKGDSKGAQDILSANLQCHPDDAASNEMLAELVVKRLGAEIAMSMPTVRRNYETALRSDPTRAAAAVAVSKFKMGDGDLTGAAKALEQSLLAHPRDVALHLQMAAVLVKQRKFGEANEQFNTGTVLDPHNAQAYCDWGAMLTDFDRPTAAAQVLQTSLDLDPTSARTHTELGRALLELALDNQGDMQDARKEFEKALDLDKAYVPAYVQCARMMLAQKNEQAALNFLKDAVTLQPGNATAQQMLARILLTADERSLRDVPAGLQALGEAVRATDFKDLSILVGYAGALAGAGYYDSAADMLARAMALPGVSDAQKESIAAMRQKYAVASIPENTGPRSVLDPGAMDIEPLADYPEWDLSGARARSVLNTAPEPVTGRPLAGTWEHPVAGPPGDGTAGSRP